MNITSYNITDVGYHYIGLRVLESLPSNSNRDVQTGAVSRAVLKYVIDRSLRLMLPEPRGTFEAVGEKVCQELVHFQFARSERTRYELTDGGRHALTLLAAHKNAELRRLMVKVHVQTYDNLRLILQRHLQLGAIYRPVVETALLADPSYIERLLLPTLGQSDARDAEEMLSLVRGKSAKQVQDIVRERVLRTVLADMVVSEPLFRSICDRMASLRLLNLTRVIQPGCEFEKTYSPCALEPPPDDWHFRISITLRTGDNYVFCLSEPNMADLRMQREFMAALEQAFAALQTQAGYYDLPKVREFVCERLLIPEAAFDDGVNRLLDLRPSPLTAGLRYEGISGRRKPLTRSSEPSQIYNLVRRV